ncbi:MAG: FadR family transcriptional regulator [Deltaproteobacteria bacterium]|nr:MAG: FadR family transcriptional regulator [Deltaproteobacteria bacterium]
MNYTHVPKGRLADLVSGQLKESIFQGEYQSGERIPPEHQLVEIFGVSRVIVREAIRNLEQAGLIEIKRGPKGGAFVLPMKHDAVSQVIKDMLRLGNAKVAHIMEVRLDMEPVVTGLAAERATAEDMEILCRGIEDMPDAPGDEYVAWNVNFHRLLAKCAHNPMYDILVNILMDFTEELILKIKPSERIIHDTTSHPELLELVRQGDAEGARRKMRFHLEDIVPTLKDLEDKMLAASGGSDGSSSEIGQVLGPSPGGRYQEQG